MTSDRMEAPIQSFSRLLTRDYDMNEMPPAKFSFVIFRC